MFPKSKIETARLLRLTDFAALAWFGTVCSSWIWIAKESTRRSLRNPRGNMQVSSMLEDNKIVARTAVMILICYSKSVSWVLEQPARSLMTHHPAMVWVGKCVRSLLGLPWWNFSTYMGAFAGETVKPHTLYGCSPWNGAMARKHPGQIGAGGDHVVKTYVDKRGRSKVVGGPRLKDTQAYSEAFGVAVASSFYDMDGDEELRSQMNMHGRDGIDEADEVSFEQAWADLDVDSVLDVVAEWRRKARKWR